MTWGPWSKFNFQRVTVFPTNRDKHGFPEVIFFWISHLSLSTFTTSIPHSDLKRADLVVWPSGYENMQFTGMKHIKIYTIT